MNKDRLIEIIEFLESKKMVLIMFFILLVMIPLTIMLGYSNCKLEEQIYERDIHIRNLQYRDSIAQQILCIESNDSVSYLKYIVRDGKMVSYKELMEDNTDIRQEYIHMLEENINLSRELDDYKVLLELAQKTYSFDYSITRKNDSTYLRVWSK